jgi:hypothetical protein
MRKALLPNSQFNSRKEAVSKLELEKVLYDASESISSKILSSAIPDSKSHGKIDLWELENLLTPILNSVVNGVSSIDYSLAESLSFEIKRRKSSLLDDIVSFLLESLKDAFRDSIEIDYPTPRIIHLRFRKKIENTAFLKKEFSIKVYDILRHLVGK